MSSTLKEDVHELFTRANALVVDVFAVLMPYLEHIPGSRPVLRYIKASHQNDPFRTFLEAALVVFVIVTYTRSRTQSDMSRDSGYVKLSAKEVEDLVSEWEPEPLVDEHPVGASVELPEEPQIVGANGTHTVVRYPGSTNLELVAGKKMHDLSSINFAGFLNHAYLKGVVDKYLNVYGVGSCGPSGFYGTFDVHLEVEDDIARFIGTEASIMYPQAFVAVQSALQTFARRGDVLVLDHGVNFALQRGALVSRASLYWYDHNDLDSLELILQAITRDDKRYNRDPTKSRRFIVTEGLFEKFGDITDLRRLVELRNKYKFRIMLDETWSFGALGATGRGATEYWGVNPRDVDMILGSLAHSIGSAGGFVASSEHACRHQRINSPGFTFTASLPPTLAIAASYAIALLGGDINAFKDPEAVRPDEKQLGTIARLPENIRIVRAALEAVADRISVPAHPASPLIHIFTKNDALSLADQQRALQRVIDTAAAAGVFLSQVRQHWEQVLFDTRPSIRICVSAAHDPAELRVSMEIVAQAIEAGMY